MRSMADHIYDITYNSIKADAKNIMLKLEIDSIAHNFFFKVKDDGKGIEKDKMEKIFDPFYTTRDSKIRKVGLGLPFLKMNTEHTGGYVKIESEYGVGTNLEALFKLNDFDIPEMGDIAGTLVGLISFKEGIEWTIILSKDENMESITTTEIKEALGEGVPFNDIDVMNALKEMFQNIMTGIEFKY